MTQVLWLGPGSQGGTRQQAAGDPPPIPFTPSSRLLGFPPKPAMLTQTEAACRLLGPLPSWTLETTEVGHHLVPGTVTPEGTEARQARKVYTEGCLAVPVGRGARFQEQGRHPEPGLHPNSSSQASRSPSPIVCTPMGWGSSLLLLSALPTWGWTARPLGSWPPQLRRGGELGLPRTREGLGQRCGQGGRRPAGQGPGPAGALQLDRPPGLA